MSQPTKLVGRLYGAVIALGLVVIALFVNLLAGEVFTRVDLTAQNLNTLSPASIEAVAALEDLEVTAYISSDLPESVRDDSGQMRVLRNVVQSLRDKLEEYRSYADGSMILREINDNAVEQGREAKLRVFAGEEATASNGQLKFKEYVLGVTFAYKNVMEVLPLALQPEHYEFELTRIFLRLKAKAEHAILMKDVLRAGETVDAQVSQCAESLTKAAPEQDAPQNPFALLSKEASTARVEAYRAALETINTDCAGIADALTTANELEESHPALERVVMMASAFNQSVEGFTTMLSSEDAGQSGQALGLVKQLEAIAAEVDREHDALVDAPGQKSIGFFCGAKAFCPFPETTPLIPPEIQPVLGQKNPFAQQIVGQLQQMEERIGMILSNVERNLFRQRGFNIERVDLNDEIPDAVSSIVIFGPKADLTDFQLYTLDQFVLNGGSLVVFLNPWDVKIQNFSAKGELNLTELKKNGSNINTLLGHWGIEVDDALVAEPEKNDVINVLALIRQGQFTWQTQRSFPYPLLPVLDAFDSEAALVRGVASMTLPYAAPLRMRATDEGGSQTTALVKTSSNAVTVSDPAFPLEPNAQLGRLATMSGTGPHVVVATVTGELTSWFQGKEAPNAPESTPSEPGEAEVVDQPDTRRDSGQGRVLVVGSNLGLEPLSREAIFEGFDVGQLTNGSFEVIETAKQWVANLQNWEVHLGQIQHTLPDNLQFLFNALDWSIQQEGLVEIRAKRYRRRPLKQLEDEEKTWFKAAGVGLGPLLLLLLGLGHWANRRARIRKLSV